MICRLNFFFPAKLGSLHDVLQVRQLWQPLFSHPVLLSLVWVHNSIYVSHWHRTVCTFTSQFPRAMLHPICVKPLCEIATPKAGVCGHPGSVGQLVMLTFVSEHLRVQPFWEAKLCSSLWSQRDLNITSQISSYKNLSSPHFPVCSFFYFFSLYFHFSHLLQPLFLLGLFYLYIDFLITHPPFLLFYLLLKISWITFTQLIGSHSLLFWVNASGVYIHTEKRTEKGIRGDE